VEKHSGEFQSSMWITLVILASVDLIITYGDTMLLPSINNIIKDFDISYNISSWILTSYLIPGAAMTPIAGKLSDIYGKKKMVLIIFCIYIIGISIGSISTNIYILITARIIQGIGISVIPIAFGIIIDQFPKRNIATAVGIYNSMFNLGSVLGIAIGGEIIQNFGWQSTFFTTMPFAIILWLIIKKFIPEDKPKESKETKRNQLNSIPNTNTQHKIGNRIDPLKTDSRKKNSIKIYIRGVLAMTITITSFLLTLTYLSNINDNGTTAFSEKHYQSIVLIAFAILTIISLISFIIIEKKSSTPLIPIELVKNKVLLFNNIILLAYGITLFIVFQTIPILTTSPPPIGFSVNSIGSANIQLPFVLVFLIFAPFSSIIISKIGDIKPIIIGTIITTLGFFSLLIFHNMISSIMINLIFISTGLSLINIGGFNIVLQYTPSQFSGISTGISVVIILIGSSVGPVIATTFMQRFQEFVDGTNSKLFPSLMSYNFIFLTTTLISIISIASAISLKNKIDLITIGK
jgi:MFS family permease